MARNVYVISMIDLDGTVIPQIRDRRLSPGVEDKNASTSSDLESGFAGLFPAMDRENLSFSTEAVAIALGKIGLDGFALTAQAPLTCYKRRLQHGGSRASGSVHKRDVISGGAVIPVSLESALDDYATLSVQAFASSSDGSAVPIATTENVALPAMTATQEAFTAGPAKVNNVMIDLVQRISIDYGYQMKTYRGGNDEQVTVVVQMRREPVITIETLDWDSIQTLGLTYGAAVSATTRTWLRKVQKGGRFIANNVAQHISHTVTDGTVMLENSGGDNEETATLRIKPIKSATTPSLVISTAAAIA